VLVVLDAARAASFGCYGGSSSATPAVDNLARESVLFEQAFTPAPYTRAAMTAVWTSRDPGERGLRKAPRLAEILSAHDVTTAGFLANPNAGKNAGLARGFKRFEELDGMPPRSDELVPAFERFVRESHGRFFAYVHVREPHFPYDPPASFKAPFGAPRLLPAEAFTDPDWIDSLNRRGGPTEAEASDLRRMYQANLAFADSLVGRLRRVLESSGAWKDTAFILTADHGEALGEHGFVGHNLQVYAESAQVPLLVRVPGVPPTRRTPLASLIDLAPTIAGLLEAKDPKVRFRGQDLLATSGEEERRLLCVASGNEPAVAWRDELHTLVVSGQKAELFDRADDPGEARDRASEEPGVIARMLKELELARVDLAAVPVPDPERPTPEQKERLRALGYAE
jgi:arylsulfatase A-like enzyme